MTNSFTSLEESLERDCGKYEQAVKSMPPGSLSEYSRIIDKLVIDITKSNEILKTIKIKEW